MERLGVQSEKVKDVFQILSPLSVYDPRNPAKFLIEHFTMLLSVNAIPSVLQSLQKCFRGKSTRHDYCNDEVVTCHSIPDKIGGLPFFLDLHLTSRDYFLETLENLRENGLLEKWDHWSTYANKLYKSYYGDVITRSCLDDAIDMRKLSAVFLLWVCLNGISLAAVLIDIFWIWLLKTK